MVKGIIFDFDGVIVDSETIYLQSVVNYLASKGIDSTLKDVICLLGQSMTDIANILVEKYNLTDSIQQIIDESLSYYDQIAVYENFPLMEGIREFLDEGKKRNIKMAIASSSSMEYLKTLTQQFNIDKYFDYIITGDDFKKSKPDPEIYNVTAKLLGIEKESLIVIEDSVSGIKAGKAAEIFTIGFKGSVVEQDTSNADVTAFTFKEISKIINWEEN